MTGPSSNSSGRHGAPPVVDKEVDFANYFCTYAFLYHQKEMLSDHVRMRAYCGAIKKNARQFKDKVVLDVGTGSGILAIWCAQAGARKVYAVETTDMAVHARNLVESNGFSTVVEVIQGSIEDITLPEKVDIIISEWMGYFLVRESMLDSVIVARDRWLKPDGIMYPSHARMFLAPIRTNLGDQRYAEYSHSMEDWDNFVQETFQGYGVNMSLLTKPFEEEQRKYFLQTSQWSNVNPNQLVGQPTVIKEIDCREVRLDDILVISSPFKSNLHDGMTRISAFCGWFDVSFKGSKNDPADVVVDLSTAPSFDAQTHWGQQVFLLHDAVRLNGDCTHIEGEIQISRSQKNHRLMDVALKFSVMNGIDALSNAYASKVYIE